MEGGEWFMQKFSNLPKMTELIGGEVQIQIQAAWDRDQALTPWAAPPPNCLSKAHPGSGMEPELLARDTAGGKPGTSVVPERGYAALNPAMAMGVEKEMATPTHGGCDGTTSHF